LGSPVHSQPIPPFYCTYIVDPGFWHYLDFDKNYRFLDEEIHLGSFAFAFRYPDNKIQSQNVVGLFHPVDIA
jgi:hypothetical protein